MSDTIMIIYVIVTIGVITALLLQSAKRHRRIVSLLILWTFIGTFLSTTGGLLILGTFTPNMADYSETSRQLYNVFTWGGIELPEYNDVLGNINNLGVIINALGLGVLVMAVLCGFFPRSFLLPVSEGASVGNHNSSKKAG